jgi:hypothetical protein
MPSSSTKDGRFLLPRPTRVILRNFSLYDNTSLIEAELGSGVFCLAGANGLGKSTFLSAVNFAITGVVADPSRKFDSTVEYLKKSQTYSADYFRGRIDELDAEAAQVELEMLVGDRRYRIVRGMFDPSGLREFDILTADGNPLFESSSLDIDDNSRHLEYSRAIAKDVGLDSFAQLVFLQHFVLTFDERRHLLFWDERVAQTALHIAFGLDAEKAGQADTLRRAVEKADSLARNLQWQATDLRKRLKDLQEAIAPEQDDEDLGERHRRILDELDVASARLRQLEDQVRDVDLRTAERRAQLSAAADEYDSAFKELATGGAPVHHHPIVSMALGQSSCAVCGTASPTVSIAVRHALDHALCPVCDSPISSPGESSAKTIERIEALETLLTEHRRELEQQDVAASRLADSVADARSDCERLAAELAEFEALNEAVLFRTTAPQGGTLAIGRFQAEIAELMGRKRQQLDRRNAARAELAVLERALAAAYGEAESTFVPRFTELAREFLGLDLEIRLQTQTSGVGLVLTVQGTTRRVQDSLSESQRFFVDIALRMALAQQMSKSGSPACLYVDTPEGSLDIAYESRAGSMFGQFVSSGDQLVMTANINTSQLLRRLASTCGPARMKLLRMTEWTSLSEVQSAEENLFDEAYSAIEAALEAGG